MGTVEIRFSEEMPRAGQVEAVRSVINAFDAFQQTLPGNRGSPLLPIERKLLESFLAAHLKGMVTPPPG